MRRKKIIIAIHGLGNKPPKDVLENWWQQSIREGLDRIEKPVIHIPFKLVYWADITHPEPYDPEITKKNHKLFVSEPYIPSDKQVVEKKSVFKRKLFSYIEKKLDEVFLNDDLSINYKQITDAIIHRYFSDLDRYFADDYMSLFDPNLSVKDCIQKRLYEVLQEYRGWEIMLIAHSMGSIVALDVLSKYAPELNIDTLITIGSPLGLPVIMSRVFAAQKSHDAKLKKPHAPDCIWPNWYNLSDPEDRIAIDHSLNDDFAPNRLGVNALDLLVYNDYEVDGERNPHKAYGYLRAPLMSEIIHDFLVRTRAGTMFRRSHKFTKKLIADFKDFRKSRKEMR